MISNKISKKKFEFSKVVLHTIMVAFCLFCLIPLLLVISISISDETALLANGYKLIPEKFSGSAYIYVLQNHTQLVNAYLVTISVTVIGAIAGLLISSMLAYTTIRKDYKYRNITSFLVFFTTLFNGGLIPWYILIVNYLHLKNTLAVLFLPYLVNVWYVFLMRGFMQSMPFSLIESAKIDGASENKIFYSIVLPLSKPGLATVGLFYALLFWNDWWLPLLFIDNNKYVSLQLLLSRVLNNMDFLSKLQSQGATSSMGFDAVKLPQLSARMAMCVLAAGPMLFVFPFFQKYFVKGITIGSLKG